jgi:hypothetical protein
MIRKQASRFLCANNVLVLTGLIVIACCTLAALASAWRWPLIGDASLMRYTVFLLQHGRKPYSQIIDINLPGSYLLEATAMRIFGGGATGLRIYDGALSAVICVCSVILSKNGFRARAYALAGGLLLVLIHLRDGVVQAAQRDYAILAIVLIAYVLLLRGPLSMRPARELLASLVAGITITIKPTMLLLILLPLSALFLQHVNPRNTVMKVFGIVIAFLTPLAGMFIWLHTWHAIPAFLRCMELARRSHSLLAHKSLGFLLVHSVQPVTVLFAIGFALLAQQRFRLDVDQKLLLLGATAGLGSFLIQGKGFSYQRYPFLGLLLIAIFSLLADEPEAQPLRRALATAGLVLSCFWWAPRFAYTISKYDHATPFQDSLGLELANLHVRPGDVQCLDTVGGCVNVLYDKHLLQSTGYLFDCYAYAGPAAERVTYRQSFLAALETAQPRYIVLTGASCLMAQSNSGRIAEWPALGEWLNQNYAETESWQSSQVLHWWHQPETPPSFEILKRK